ncbi:TRAT1 protein, partial [Acrocephalus arundinaceus]|nr:TRAT1 protein [Acrocephalus arundinaceus]
TGMECHFSIWGVLVFLSLALVVSLTLNITHCMKKKRAKMHKDYKESNPSYDGYHTEDYPVYGNLNQDILEECCYEQMKSQPQRQVNQLQVSLILVMDFLIRVESANQMCYASLDHSVKGKCRKPRRKKDPSLEEHEEERSSNPMVASKVSIYLNSEQLAAENTAKVEAIHDDPIRLMGLIHNTKGEN